jgi:hypothetical protein
MLKPGSISVDIETGGIYGDIDHCPLPDLLESAEALWSLLSKVKHKGLWALAKSFDADCYLYTSNKSYKPPDGITLEQNIYRGAGGLPASCRPFILIVMPYGDRKDYFNRNWYEPLVGSIRDGKATSNTDGIPDLGAEGRAKMEKQKREWAEKEARKGKQEAMFTDLPRTTTRRVVTPRTTPRPAAKPAPAKPKEGDMARMF